MRTHEAVRRLIFRQMGIPCKRAKGRSLTYASEGQGRYASLRSAPKVIVHHGVGLKAKLAALSKAKAAHFHVLQSCRVRYDSSERDMQRPCHFALAFFRNPACASCKWLTLNLRTSTKEHLDQRKA